MKAITVSIAARTARDEVRLRFLNLMRQSAKVEAEMGRARGPGAPEDYDAVEREALRFLKQWKLPGPPQAPKAR